MNKFNGPTVGEFKTHSSVRLSGFARSWNFWNDTWIKSVYSTDYIRGVDSKYASLKLSLFLPNQDTGHGFRASVDQVNDTTNVYIDVIGGTEIDAFVQVMKDFIEKYEAARNVKTD